MKSVNQDSKPLRLFLSSLTFVLFFTMQLFAQSGDAENGKKIFNANCAACHKLDKKSIGPALEGVSEKRTREWLHAWIKDNNALRESGDADAIAIFEEYNRMPMIAYPNLSEQDIDDIIAYTDNKPVEKKADVGTAEASNVAEVAPIPWATYLVLLVVALFAIWVYFIGGNQFLKFLTTIAILIGTGYILYAWLMGIGVDQGYKPIQPIAFSHKIHAGDNKIDCQYCHSNAKHSKLSGIPSVNVCMNCHKSIAEYNGPVTEEKDKAFYDGEIQKIYDAIGWDKEKLAYIEGYEQKPIEWIRIHNLPDLAYYNHSQHVTVAGLECQTCHGPVEEMHEVEQFAPLTMGWCLDCHKKTEIKMESNEYYAKIHEQLSKKYGVEKVTVAQMGGRECGKCHY